MKEEEDIKLYEFFGPEHSPRNMKRKRQKEHLEEKNEIKL